MLILGAHLSASKGYVHMLREAQSIGANTFQFFTRNPRGGAVKAQDPADVAAFLQGAQAADFGTVLAHAPYTMNMCSDKERTRTFAREVFADDLQRLEALPGTLYNFHPGSHVGQGTDNGIAYITRALNDQSLPVYGKGENVRDWLYVEDHCAAIDLVMRKGREGEVYNVGGHNERTNLDVVKTVLRELGKPESLITFVTDRPGHDRRYAIDPSKIHAELGWLPRTKFDDGIHQTVQWYLDNRQWWEHILAGEYQNYYQAMYGNR